MTRKKRIVAMLVAAALVAVAVFGIATWSASYTPGQVEPGLYVDGKQTDAPETMLTIGEYEVSFSEYRHYFLLMRSYFEMSYGTNIWDDDPDGEKAYVLRQAVEEELVSLYTWLTIAAENGIELSDEDRQEIADTLAEQKETHGDNFEAQLAEMFFPDEETYLSITEKQKLAEVAQTEYQQQLYDAEEETLGAEADEEYRQAYITAKHILIAFPEEDAAQDGTDASSLPEDAADAADSSLAEYTSGADDSLNTDNSAISDGEAQALTMATEMYNVILARMWSGEDLETVFDEYMWEYTADMSGTEANPNGYTFTDGEMVTEFYEGALALEEYQMSQPIRTDYGYHIILRLPLDETAMEENRDNAIYNAVNTLINKKVAQVGESLPVVGSDVYADLQPASIQ